MVKNGHDKDWALIKEYFIRTTETVFKEKFSLEYAFSFSNGIDLLIKIIEHQISQRDLDGLTLKLKQPLLEIAEGSKRSVMLNNLKLFAISTEAYLRKILFITNKIRYKELDKKRIGFNVLINELINPDKISFPMSSPEDLKQNAEFAEYISRAYPLRNEEAHKSPEWNEEEMFLYLKSISVLYLFATFRHYDRLIAATTYTIDYSLYRKKVIGQYKIWERRYVDINAITDEGFAIEKFDFDFVEVEWENEDNIEELSEDIQEQKAGKLSELLELSKRFVVVGQPGMGKSTTLQFLSYRLAVEGIYVPIYIELKHYTEEDSLFEMLSLSIGVPVEVFLAELSNEKLVIFLDGLNEVIRTEARLKLNNQIAQLLSKATNFLFVLSSRRVAYNNDFNLPVFQLQMMDDGRIKEFIKRNYPKSEEAFFTLLLKNKRLYAWSKNPLMLKMLLSVVEKTNGVIPDNIGKLLRAFTDGIFKRELKKRPTLNIDELKELLSYLAFQTRQNENVGFSKESALNISRERADFLGLKTDLLSFIRLTLDINLLSQHNELLGFAHEFYQEYFAAEYLMKIYETTPHNITQFVKNPNWNEPIIILKGIYDGPNKLLEDIALHDLLLAAKSLKNGVSCQEEELFLFEKATVAASDVFNKERATQGLYVLIEMNKYSDALKILSKDTLQSRFLKPKKIFIQLLEKIVGDSVQLQNFYGQIISISNKSFIAWFWGTLVSTNYKNEFYSFLETRAFSEEERNQNVIKYTLAKNMFFLYRNFFIEKKFDSQKLTQSQKTTLLRNVKNIVVNTKNIDSGLAQEFNEIAQKNEFPEHLIFFNTSFDCIVDEKYEYGIRVIIPSLAYVGFVHVGDVRGFNEISKGDTIRLRVTTKVKHGYRIMS